jgi:hypothetical protein
VRASGQAGDGATVFLFYKMEANLNGVPFEASWLDRRLVTLTLVGEVRCTGNRLS